MVDETTFYRCQEAERLPRDSHCCIHVEPLPPTFRSLDTQARPYFADLSAPEEQSNKTVLFKPISVVILGCELAPEVAIYSSLEFPRH